MQNPDSEPHPDPSPSEALSAVMESHGSSLVFTAMLEASKAFGPSWRIVSEITIRSALAHMPDADVEELADDLDPRDHLRAVLEVYAEDACSSDNWLNYVCLEGPDGRVAVVQDGEYWSLDHVATTVDEAAEVIWSLFCDRLPNGVVIDGREQDHESFIDIVEKAKAGRGG